MHTLKFEKSDVEAKYYADGEDAFAMKKDLTEFMENLPKPKKLKLSFRERGPDEMITQPTGDKEHDSSMEGEPTSGVSNYAEENLAQMVRQTL